MDLLKTISFILSKSSDKAIRKATQNKIQELKLEKDSLIKAYLLIERYFTHFAVRSKSKKEFRKQYKLIPLYQTFSRYADRCLVGDSLCLADNEKVIRLLNSYAHDINDLDELIQSLSGTGPKTSYLAGL